MTSGAQRPPLADAEVLARFVLFANRVRHDGTVKGDAFMPPPNLELSGTRHAAATEERLWQRGMSVAAASGRDLVGRADISVQAIRAAAPLDAVAAELPDDPGHANIIGWPPDKPHQKILALAMAAAATFSRRPYDR
jgi:hypothetical protein